MPKMQIFFCILLHSYNLTAKLTNNWGYSVQKIQKFKDSLFRNFKKFKAVSQKILKH